MDPRIKKLKTEKECLNFARNAEERGMRDLVDEANLRASLIRREDYKSRGRRPDIDYHIIGLKNDDAIYLPNVDIEASVFSHRTLLFKGSEIYITPLEESLINKGGLKRNQVVGKWRCKKTDELIDDMYRRIYPR